MKTLVASDEPVSGARRSLYALIRMKIEDARSFLTRR